MNIDMPRSDVVAVRHFDGQTNVAKAISAGLFPAGAVNSTVIKAVEHGRRTACGCAT